MDGEGECRLMFHGIEVSDAPMEGQGKVIHAIWIRYEGLLEVGISRSATPLPFGTITEGEGQSLKHMNLDMSTTYYIYRGHPHPPDLYVHHQFLRCNDMQATSALHSCTFHPSRRSRKLVIMCRESR